MGSVASGMSKRQKELESELSNLKDKNLKLLAFAKAHERWEANCLNDGPPWVDEMISDDEFHEVQSLRNEALKA